MCTQNINHNLQGLNKFQEIIIIQMIFSSGDKINLEINNKG